MCEESSGSSGDMATPVSCHKYSYITTCGYVYYHLIWHSNIYRWVASFPDIDWLTVVGETKMVVTSPLATQFTHCHTQVELGV